LQIDDDAVDEYEIEEIHADEECSECHPQASFYFRMIEAFIALQKSGHEDDGCD
jgi:hypothetical protein